MLLYGSGVQAALLNDVSLNPCSRPSRSNVGVHCSACESPSSTTSRGDVASPKVQGWGWTVNGPSMQVSWPSRCLMPGSDAITCGGSCLSCAPSATSRSTSPTGAVGTC